MKKWIFLLFLLANIGSAEPILAQNAIDSILNNPAPYPEEDITDTISPLSSYEYYLSLIVLSFGFLIICLEIFLIKSKRITAEDTIKFIIITLIIISTLFLITAGYSNDQIAPAVGLLGTVAGYLLGRIQNNKEESDEK